MGCFAAFSDMYTLLCSDSHTHIHIATRFCCHLSVLVSVSLSITWPSSTATASQVSWLPEASMRM